MRNSKSILHVRENRWAQTTLRTTDPRRFTIKDIASLLDLA
jgi:hypothetical protein